MHSMKVLNNDFFLLLLLLVRLGLEPNIHINNRWNREPEIRSVFLGQTSAYTQTSFHASYSGHNYPHPKSLQYLEVDEVSNLFSRLNFYNSLRDGQGSLIACIANSLDKENSEQYPDNCNTGGSGNDFGDHSLQSGNGNPRQVIGGIPASERESPRILDTPVELSLEDMDLIEILWKQDIDLGVSREAYDSRPCVEVEKLKGVDIKEEEEFYGDLENTACEEVSPVPDLCTGLNYTIDSETGEYVFEEFPDLTNGDFPAEELLKDDTKLLSNDLLLRNETFGALNEDSYLPFDPDDEFCDFSALFSPSQFSQILPDDISTDSDYLSQIEDLERKLEQFENLSEPDGANTTTGEIYPNMDECWPDTTTMLPLLALSNAHPSPIPPHPLHGYPSASTNSTLHLSATQPTRPNDTFISMLQHSGMEVAVTEEEFHPASMPSAIGPSSIGCAVAESMATLTNDTDPIPNGNIINAAYNSEFPELLYSNHTVTVPHNELLISDLLLDEDLHLVPLPSNDNEEKLDDHMDTSSDSVSLTSRQLQPPSDYENDRSFSDVHFDHPNCNDPQYFSLKSYYSEGCAGSVPNGKMGFTKKFEYSLPKSSGTGSSNFVHHNHSYHLPFSNEDSHFKPVAKDKYKGCSSEDDSCNKDEKRAKELNLPISIDDIINLAIDEYNERLSKYELTEAQLTLIRDIRRRGKNKVAAQNCRKRKMDQISGLKRDLGFLQREKMQLESKQSNLLQEKHHFEEKYAQLYDLVLQTSNSKPPTPPNNIPVTRNGGIIFPTNSELFTEDDTDPNRGTRTKRKYKK